MVLRVQAQQGGAQHGSAPEVERPRDLLPGQAPGLGFTNLRGQAREVTVRSGAAAKASS